MTTRAYVRVPLGAIALAAATVATWWAWLGWDTEYQYENGSQTGPYETWQVVGCVLCLAVLAFVGGALLGAVVVVPVMTVAFTATWVAWASSDPGDGLWPVGAAMLAVGLWMGSAVVSLTGQAARALARRAAGQPGSAEIRVVGGAP
jgi:hypothetical protein